MGRSRVIPLVLLAASALLSARSFAEPLQHPDPETFTREAAERMIGGAEGKLAPVYAPLAEYLVEELDLSGKPGIGIDLGSGPGSLIFEMCPRTDLHWVNADINPHFFPYFLKKADEKGFGGRVSAIFADAGWLPFRDGYADVIVSRGSFQFWGDKIAAFREIRRVLKPGGVAWIGRGFSPNLPVETAEKIRETQKKPGSFPKYDVKETEKELRELLPEAGIDNYKIHIPDVRNAKGEKVNYGIWVEIRKMEGRQ